MSVREVLEAGISIFDGSARPSPIWERVAAEQPGEGMRRRRRGGSLQRNIPSSVAFGDTFSPLGEGPGGRRASIFYDVGSIAFNRSPTWLSSADTSSTCRVIRERRIFAISG